MVMPPNGPDAPSIHARTQHVTLSFSLADHFAVEKINGAWKLKTKSALDYEETKTISFKLKALKDINGDCSSSNFGNQLLG